MDKNDTTLYDLYLLLTDERYGEQNRRKFADDCMQELSSIIAATRQAFRNQYNHSKKHR